MREITTLPLEERRLRHRLARLRPRTVQRLRSATVGCIGHVARGIELAIVTVGWALIPVLPFVAAAVTRDTQFARRYPATLVQVARHIRATWRGRALSRMLLRRFEPAAVRGRQRITGTCTHCGNCCLYRSCMFLRFDQAGRSSCRIYGTRLWKRLTCGEYPVDAGEIDLYSCPSFTASADGARPVVRRVIALVPTERSGAGDGV